MVSSDQIHKKWINRFKMYVKYQKDKVYDSDELVSYFWYDCSDKDCQILHYRVQYYYSYEKYTNASYYCLN